MANVFGHTGVGQGGGRDLVAARRPPDAQVNAVGIQGVQHTEGFGDLEGAVMGQHHAAGADADAAGMGGDLADEHFRGGAGEVGQVVVFGHPIALVAQLFGGHRQLDAFPQGGAGVAALAHRRLVNHAQLQFLAQNHLPRRRRSPAPAPSPAGRQNTRNCGLMRRGRRNAAPARRCSGRLF